MASAVPVGDWIGPSPGRRVRITSLGCRLNEAEAEAWTRGFRAAGLEVVSDDTPADLLVINTCAVTQEAVRKSRQLLRRQQRVNPLAKVVVSGCLATLGDEHVRQASGVDLIVPNRDKDRLVEIALEQLAIPAMPELATSETTAALFCRGRQRAFVKVQDGCRHQCTFCVTTQARGAERSRPIPEIVGAIERLVEQGLHEVVLTGVHLGGFGSDQGARLTDLIARILAETGVRRLRLGSLEPWGWGDDLWRLFADTRLMPHLHLPLQSGSDPVLRRMARRCKRAQFERLVEEGRARVPALNLTTDIIVGFPGEDAHDWQQTLDCVEAMRFGHVHAFAYSPRAGTLAAGLSEQVPDQIKRARLVELQGLASRLKAEVLADQVGKVVEILVEGRPEDARRHDRSGYTPNYLPVQIQTAGQAIAPNQVVPVILTGLDPAAGQLIGQPVS